MNHVTPPRFLATPLFLLLVLLPSCAGTGGDARRSEVFHLEQIASSEEQWTGIAVTEDERIFVNYPRWSDAMRWSVARLDASGAALPFPDARWNLWQPGQPVAEDRFVCVQSVVCDAEGRLWVLDTGNPFFGGVIAGGPRLFCFDPDSAALLATHSFSSPIVKPDSYLNDVRLDLANGFAYITDSGAGGLVALDLETGVARRFLTDHPATRSEDLDVVIDGKPWRGPRGKPQVHADGIAYDAPRDLLYFQALTGATLYRLNAAVLRDPTTDDTRAAAALERVATHYPVDGLLCDEAGRIYLSNLQESAIDRLVPGPSPRLSRLVSGRAIAWPDSFSRTADGTLYFTTARIHQGNAPTDDYGIFRLRLRSATTPPRKIY